MDKVFGKLGKYVNPDLREGNPNVAGNEPQQPLGSHSTETPIWPQPGQRVPGRGVMPPKVISKQYHDRMKFHLPNGKQHGVMLDLGFTGVIDGKIVWTFGDTLMGDEKNSMICATDSIAIGNLKEPMSVTNTCLWDHGTNVKEWIPINAEQEARGGLSVWSNRGTNVVEIAPNEGLTYYLKCHRPEGVQRFIGAGIATVKMHGDIPKATLVKDDQAESSIWLNTEPQWGDVGIAYNAQDGFVYAYGHGPDYDKELSSRTYLCKAPAAQATDINAYQYWNNDEKQWTRQRFMNGENGTLKLEQKHALFDWFAMNQTTPFWSNYYNKWMMMHSTGFPDSDIICKTADKLEGPWEDHGVLATTKPKGHGDGMRYSVTGHPWIDPTGKKVLVTWTRNNVIWGVTIEFE